MHLDFFVCVLNGIYAIRRCLPVAHRGPWSRPCSLSSEPFVGVPIPVSSAIKTIIIHIYLQYRQYHRHAGGVWLPYDRGFIKQHNRNMWWERSGIEADRGHNWLLVLIRVQLYLIFIFEDGVYLPLQDTAINNIAVSECQMTSSTRWVRGLRSNENC
jgi:hypothetical protein